MKFLPRLVLLLACFLQLDLAAAPDAHQLAKTFFAQPKVADVRLSPGNRGFSYVHHSRSTGSLRLIDLQSRRNYAVNAPDNASVYEHYWIDRDTALVYMQKLGSPIGAFTTSYRLGSAKETPFALVFDTLPDMKSVYLAKEGRRTDKFPDLYRLNAHTGSRQRVTENPGNVITYFTDKDGIPRIRYTIDPDESDVYEYKDSDDAPWRRLAIDGHPLGVLFTNNPNEIVLFIRRSGEDRFAAYRFDVIGNQYLDTLVIHPEYDIVFSEIVVDPETEETFGFRYHLDKPSVHWFDNAFRGYQARIDLQHPDTLNDILGYGPDRASIVYRSSSDRAPSLWRTIDLTTGTAETLLAEMPQIDPATTVPIAPITFAARDGARIHGYLTRPTNANNQPTKTLLMIHGGPRARDYWGWDAEAQFFAALGYTVLKVNYRGSEGYGLAYSPYSHFSSMVTSVQDTIDAARWLVESGVADPAQIAIYGSSFGGHVALRCAQEAPDLFVASIGYAGVYDWLAEIDDEFREEPVYARLKIKTYYGDYENERPKWLAASAISSVDKIRCPVLLVHGRSDTTVSASQSRRMHAALRKAGVASKLKLLSFNQHGLSLEKSRIEFFTELARFLQASLSTGARPTAPYPSR